MLVFARIGGKPIREVLDEIKAWFKKGIYSELLLTKFHFL